MIGPLFAVLIALFPGGPQTGVRFDITLERLNDATPFREPPEGPRFLSTPSDQPALRKAFIAGDLVSLYRARGLLAERGVDVNRGELGLIDDLARLVRCLPIGPIPEAEERAYRAARLLARLERVRLERVLRDGDLKSSRVAEVVEQRLFQDQAIDQSAWIVHWPQERERWPLEQPESLPERRSCPNAPGAWKEPVPEVHRARKAMRIAAERGLYTEGLGYLDVLPAHAAARVVFAYLDQAAAVGAFSLPAEWYSPLQRALASGEPELESAGLLILALLADGAEDKTRAEALYRSVLQARSVTEAEDSRARVRLVVLLEPRWDDLLAVVDGPKNPRAEDTPALSNAKARALSALGRYDELMSFGRAYLRRGVPKGEHDEQTRDLLLRVGLKLPAPDAIAWAEELSAGDAELRRTKLEALATLATNAKELSLATGIYDRLRIEASVERERRGPNAAAAEAHFIAERALVEVERDDVEAFAGFIDELVALARREEARPLARFAPHREVARLDQELIPRLVGEIEEHPDRRRFAGVLLEATVALAPSGLRWKSVLEANQDPLAKLAGPWAKGRTAAQPKEPKKKARRVRQLGQVVIPRLPPALSAVDYPSERPIIRSFLVYPDQDGRLIEGVPWEHRLYSRQAPSK